MPGYHSVKKMDSVFGKHCFKKEGGLENPVFDYTMSKRELKKKYKSDKETKDLVETSNFRTKMKAIGSEVESYGSFAKVLKSVLTGLVISKDDKSGISKSGIISTNSFAFKSLPSSKDTISILG